MMKDHEELNILRLLDPTVKKKMRKLIIQTVLGTDMKFHFDIFNKLKAKLENEINTKNDDDLFVLLFPNIVTFTMYVKINNFFKDGKSTISVIEMA